MTRHRVLIDIEFTVDDSSFKVAQLADNASGVSDVTEAGVRDAVTDGVVQTDWIRRGLVPLRSIVTTRDVDGEGDYEGVFIPADAGVDPTRPAPL